MGTPQQVETPPILRDLPQRLDTGETTYESPDRQIGT